MGMGGNVNTKSFLPHLESMGSAPLMLNLHHGPTIELTPFLSVRYRSDVTPFFCILSPCLYVG